MYCIHQRLNSYKLFVLMPISASLEFPENYFPIQNFRMMLIFSFHQSLGIPFPGYILEFIISVRKYGYFAQVAIISHFRVTFWQPGAPLN